MRKFKGLLEKHGLDKDGWEVKLNPDQQGFYIFDKYDKKGAKTVWEG